MKSLLAILSVLLALTGCSAQMSEEEYAKAFNRECQAYFRVSQELDSTPLPDKTGTSKEERRVALAQRVRQDTEKYKSLAESFRALKPPSKFVPLHAEYQACLDGQVRINTEYAEAIESNNPSLARQKNDEFISHLEAKLKSVLAQVDKLGPAGADVKREVARIASGGQ